MTVETIKKPQKTRCEWLVKPTHWLSQSRWDVLDGDEIVTSLDLVGKFFSQNLFRLGPDFYEIKRTGWFGANSLIHNGEVVATAKPSFNSQQIHFADTAILLRPERMLGLKYVVEQNGERTGWIRPSGPLGTRATTDLPMEMAPAMRVFIVWLFLSGSIAHQVAV